MSDSDSIVDLLVFGGGMAGMSAAARACSEGASVVLVEKGPGIGGSAMYAGFVWTAPTVEVMREVNPDADPELSAPGRRATTATRSIGCDRSVSMSPIPSPCSGIGRGSQTDMANYLLACDRLVREHGEAARRAWSAQRLLVEDGAVVGAEIDERIRRAAGDPRALDAAGHRWLRGRSRAARRAHPPAGRRPAAASEHAQHRRRPSAGPVGRSRVRTSETPASTAT